MAATVFELPNWLVKTILLNKWCLSRLGHSGAAYLQTLSDFNSIFCTLLLTSKLIFKVSLKIANNNWFNMESSIVLPSFGSKATAKWTDFHRLSLSPCFPPSYQDWRGIRQNVAIYSDFVGQQNFTLLLQLWSFKQNLNSFNLKRLFFVLFFCLQLMN